MNKKRTQKLSKRSRVIVSGLILAFLIVGLDHRVLVVNYPIRDERITSPVRIAFVSDLHSCSYGEDQIRLTRLIDASKPDVLLLGGDIVDDGLSEKKAWEFLEWAGKNYPTYYVTGNHELWIDDFDRVIEQIRDCGITVMAGDKAELSFNGQRIDLYGIDDPEIRKLFDGNEWYRQLDNASRQVDPEIYSVLLSHRPERYQMYSDFDLILSGHAHGGQWRLPKLLNGLFAPNQGLFPQYAGGLYDFGSYRMIVSRGLARESTLIPRFYNRPEYVVIDLLPIEK